MIKDSGSRTEFATGAVRDVQSLEKGRCDLLPLDVVAMLYRRDGRTEESIVFESLDAFTKTGMPEYLRIALVSFSRYESIADMLLEVAIHFAEGCQKYGENNWQKGIPVKRYIDSATRHYLKWLRGDTDEPHDRAFCWNLIAAAWTCKHLPELNDYRVQEVQNG